MNQKRTIMGACDYSIATMQNIKKNLANVDNINAKATWAVGGIVCSLTANLLKICTEVIETSLASGEANAMDDLTKIQNEFNQFIDRMKTND